MNVTLLIKIAHYYEEKYELGDGLDPEPSSTKDIESLSRKEVHKELNDSIEKVNEFLSELDRLPSNLLSNFERTTMERLADLPVFKIDSAQEYEKKHSKISQLRSKLEDLVKISKWFDWFGKQDKDIEVESNKALELLNKLEERLENEFGPELQKQFERDIRRQQGRRREIASPEMEDEEFMRRWNCID